jgi:hypothetical protein
LLSCVADVNPQKQGKFLPGSRIPIVEPGKILEICPDYIIVLPWNLKEEIMREISYIKDWDGKFVLIIPELKVL